jgi:transcriptional regulator with XRE-family HTH domain
VSAATLIRTSRRQKGISQAELARRARTSQSAVARIEGGQTSPTVETLERLSAALGLRLELDATEADSGVDATLVAAALRLSPTERLRRMAQAMRAIERMKARAR